MFYDCQEQMSYGWKWRGILCLTQASKPSQERSNSSCSRIVFHVISAFQESFVIYAKTKQQKHFNFESIFIISISINFQMIAALTGVFANYSECPSTDLNWYIYTKTVETVFYRNYYCSKPILTTKPFHVPLRGSTTSMIST